MAVLATWTGSTWNSTTGLTLNGLQDHAGRRLFLVGGDRGGGQTVTLSGSDAGLVTALATPIVEDVTEPTNSSNRRSAWMWSCMVPTVASNPIVACDIRDGSDVQQTGSVVAWVEDVDSSYVLDEVANANSSGSSVTSQATGTTASVPAGDVLTAVGACIRGDTTTTWTTAEDEPDNPANGNWNLEVTSGTGAGQRHVVAGRADLPAQSSQTYADTLGMGTARMATALIAVFVAADEGGQAVTPAAVTVTASAGTLTITTGVVDITPTPTTVTVSPGTLALATDVPLVGPTVAVTAGTVTITTTAGITPAPTTVTATPGSLSVSVGGATQDITPGAVTVTASAGSLALAVEVPLAGPTVAATPGTVTVTQGLAVVPDAATVTAAPGAVTVTTGAVDITPDVVTVTATPGQVTVGLAVDLAGAAVAATAGALTISTGVAAVSLAGATVAVAPGTLTVAYANTPGVLAATAPGSDLASTAAVASLAATAPAANLTVS